MIDSNFLSAAIKQFEYYKSLGEKTFAQIDDESFFWKFNDDANSISTIVKHLWGNMLSRWTDFLTTDGEKDWRNRDAEFENDIRTKSEILLKWEQGWQCLFNALNNLSEEDLNKIIYIRNQGQTVLEAICRQLCHYSYHVGQIVFVGKMICKKPWSSLSIPKGNSSLYNEAKFAKPKHQEHFTDEFLKKEK